MPQIKAQASRFRITFVAVLDTLAPTVALVITLTINIRNGLITPMLRDALQAKELACIEQMTTKTMTKRKTFL